MEVRVGDMWRFQFVVFVSYHNQESHVFVVLKLEFNSSNMGWFMQTHWLCKLYSSKSILECDWY